MLTLPNKGAAPNPAFRLPLSTSLFFTVVLSARRPGQAGSVSFGR